MRCEKIKRRWQRGGPAVVLVLRCCGGNRGPNLGLGLGLVLAVAGNATTPGVRRLGLERGADEARGGWP